jgi:hypothetical protein
MVNFQDLSIFHAFLLICFACLPSLLVSYNVFLWRGQATLNTENSSTSSQKILISFWFWEILSLGNEAQAKKH